jgi:hypothetical protein
MRLQIAHDIPSPRFCLLDGTMIVAQVWAALGRPPVTRACAIELNGDGEPTT